MVLLHCSFIMFENDEVFNHGYRKRNIKINTNYDR